MPCVNRSALLPALRSSSRWRTCQPSAASTSRAKARPPTAVHAAKGFLDSGLGCGSGDWLGMTVSVDGAGCRGALAMNRQIADGRVLAAERTLRIPSELHLAHAHAEGVIRHEAPDERLPDPEEKLHGLSRLYHSDHAWERAQDPGLASGGNEARWRWRGIEAAVAGALVRREDRGHAFELENRAVDVSLAREVAGIVDEIARVEVVGSIDDEVVVLDDVHHVVHVDAHGQLDDLHIGVERLDGLRARVDLGTSHAARGVEHLTLQVRHVPHVAAHEPQGAHAGCGQVERRRRAQSAGADQQDLGAEELALALLADLREKEMPAVALDLIAGERRVLHHGEARLCPALEAALEIDHVGVAEIVERLRREHGA